jgi:transglutaminase-like putative cysteine protease
MRLDAGCEMTLEADADCPAIAMLRPRSGLAQWLVRESYEFDPWVPTTEYVDIYGNLCQRLVIPQGRMRIRVEATVETEAWIAIDCDAPVTPVAELPDSSLIYLLPSRYCPADKIGPQAQQIVQGLAPGYPQVEAIRAWIHDRIAYRYGVSNASTDALDTLNAGAGVCRDYTHVGVALTRSLNIPARMVVGYLHGLDPMDMHAWFEAFVGGRWYTFDATQDRPRGGRLVMAYGRDAADVALISNYGPLKTPSMNVWVNELPGPGSGGPSGQPAQVGAASTAGGGTATTGSPSAGTSAG